MQMLKSRLYEIELQKTPGTPDANNSKKKRLNGEADTFLCFHPYKMIKDHRTDFEVGNGPCNGWGDRWVHQSIPDE